ncbi:hypothetical protein ACTQ3M_02630 [Oscillospiraceae bacterium LCP25S3_E10]
MKYVKHTSISPHKSPDIKTTKKSGTIITNRPVMKFDKNKVLRLIGSDITKSVLRLLWKDLNKLAEITTTNIFTIMETISQFDLNIDVIDSSLSRTLYRTCAPSPFPNNDIASIKGNTTKSITEYTTDKLVKLRRFHFNIPQKP